MPSCIMLARHNTLQAHDALLPPAMASVALESIVLQYLVDKLFAIDSIRLTVCRLLGGLCWAFLVVSTWWCA